MPPPEPQPDRIARRIESGDWADLRRIDDIAGVVSRSHNTVSAALRELAKRGLVGLDRTRWIVVSPERPLRALPPDHIPERIAGRIESGQWRVLPTLVAIAGEFGCAPDTVARAMHQLAERGLVEKVSTAGSRWIILAPGETATSVAPVAGRS